MKHLEFDIYLQRIESKQFLSCVNVQCVDFTTNLAPSGGKIVNYLLEELHNYTREGEREREKSNCVGVTNEL